MIRRTRIKVCGLTTREAIETAVLAGVDAIGVVLVPSPRQVSVEHAAQLLAAVPALVTRIAVYRHPDAALVEHALNTLAVDYHQSDHTDFASSMACVPPSKRLPVVRMNAGFDAALPAVQAGSATDGVPPALTLVEGEHSGVGRAFDWSRLEGAGHCRPIMLAGGLNPENVRQAIQRIHPFAVDVSSGVERSLGVKDPLLIHAFVRAVRDADAARTPSTP